MDAKEAARIIAEEIADNKPKVNEHVALFRQIVEDAKKHYGGWHGYTTRIKEFQGKKVEFHYVGHNASHQFAVGLLDGKLLRYSFGEGDDWRLEDSHHITVWDGGSLYLGHY